MVLTRRGFGAKLPEMELSEEERRAAAALDVYSVWYQDCFGHGDDRDPASITELFLSLEEAQACARNLQQKAGPQSFERFEATNEPDKLLALYDKRLARPDAYYRIDANLVRALLAQAAKK